MSLNPGNPIFHNKPFQLLMDGGLIQLNEVIIVVCFSDVHDEFGQILALLLLLGFSTALGGREKT